MNDVALLGNVVAEAFATDDAVDAFCWRMEELLGAGYSPVIAGTLADRPDVDLHLARQLRAEVCDERTAFSILY